MSQGMEQAVHARKSSMFFSNVNWTEAVCPEGMGNNSHVVTQNPDH